MDYTPGPIGDTKYAVVELGDEPTDFVRHQLTRLGLTLTNAIVRRFPELAGTYYAIVPAGTTPARALEFKTGWPAPRLPDNPRWSGPIGEDSKRAATTVIVDLIGSKGQGFAIAEDFMPKPDDPLFKADPTTLVAHRECYQWSGTTGVSADTVSEVVRLSNWVFVSNIVVALPDATEDMGSLGTPEEIISYAATHTVAVLVGAFDGEGYILWLPA